MGPAINLGQSRRGKNVFVPSELRETHMQIVGASGRGKSKLLEHLLRQDMLNRQGLCLIDPHGTLYGEMVRWCATHRLFEHRTIRLIDPSDPDWAWGFNPLALDNAANPQRRVDAMVGACAQVWGGEDTTRTPLLMKCLRALFYLLSVNRLTLLEAMQITTAYDEDGFRRALVEKIDDPVFGYLWREFEYLAENQKRLFIEQFQSTNNRLMEFLGSPTIRRVIGQRERVIDFRKCMDDGEIVLINLAPSNDLSADNARVLGTLIVSELFLKCFGRPEGARAFYLYIDEAYRFLTKDIENILDQARKFGLHLILAHQRLGQLKEAGESIYNAVMTGAQTKIVFGGLEVADARLMAENIFIGEFDLQTAKERFNKPTVVGHVPEWVLSESTAIAESETNSPGSSSETISYNGDGEAVGRSVSESDPSSSSSRSVTESYGRSQTLRPILKDMPTTGYSLEELLYKATSRLVNQGKRQAIVKIPGHHSMAMQVANVPPGIAQQPRIDKMSREVIERTPFISPLKDVEAEFITRRDDVLTISVIPEPDDPEEHKGVEWR